MDPGPHTVDPGGDIDSLVPAGSDRHGNHDTAAGASGVNGWTGTEHVCANITVSPSGKLEQERSHNIIHNHVPDESNTEFAVNYTISNGHLSEMTSSSLPHSNGIGNEVDASFTFKCNGLQDGSYDSLVNSDINNEQPVLKNSNDTCSMSTGVENGITVNGIDSIDKECVENDVINVNDNNVVGQVEVSRSFESGLNGSSTLEGATETPSDISTLTSDISALSIAGSMEGLPADTASSPRAASDSLDCVAVKLSNMNISSQDQTDDRTTSSPRAAIDGLDCVAGKLGNMNISPQDQTDDRTPQSPRASASGVGQEASSPRTADTAAGKPGQHSKQQHDLRQLRQEGKKKSILTLADR